MYLYCEYVMSVLNEGAFEVISRGNDAINHTGIYHGNSLRTDE